MFFRVKGIFVISDFLSHEIGQKNMSQPKVGEEQPLNTLVLNLAIVAKHESTASTEASRLEPLVVWFTRQRLVDALFVHTFDVSPRLQAFVSVFPHPLDALQIFQGISFQALRPHLSS